MEVDGPVAARVSRACAARLSLKQVSSVYWAMRLRQWLQCDIAKSHFILFEILPQHVPQSLGLLRTQINSVLILYRQFLGICLLSCSEGEKEIPYTDTDLNAIRIAFTVFRRLRNDNSRRLIGLIHSVHSLPGSTTAGRPGAWQAIRLAV